MKRTIQLKIDKSMTGPLTLLALGIAGIYYSVSGPFNLYLRSLKLLEYPASNIVVFIISGLFIGGFIFNIVRDRSKTPENQLLVLDDNSITYPITKGVKTLSQTVLFSDVNQLWYKTDKESDSIILYSKQNGKSSRKELYANEFAIANEFQELDRILRMKCINITNRK